MPYTLKNDANTAGIVGVVAVDDDGTVKLWKTRGSAGSATGITVGSAVSTAGAPVTFNSAASSKYFETNTNTGSGNAVASSGIVAVTDTGVKVDRATGFAMMAVLAGTGDTVSTSAIATFIQCSRSTSDSEMTGLGRASSATNLLGTYIGDFVRGAGAEAWGASHGAGSIACTYDNASAGGQCYYGADGGSLSTSGSAGASGWMNSGDHFVGGIGGTIDQSGQVTLSNTFTSGKFLCAIIWNTRPAESVFDNIHGDWLGTLFESGASAVVSKLALLGAG
jgi:hypothetical protein